MLFRNIVQGAVTSSRNVTRDIRPGDIGRLYDLSQGIGVVLVPLLQPWCLERIDSVAAKDNMNAVC